MKQNSIFSYVKRNNNREGVGLGGNEQCSSNAQEAPNPKLTKCNSIAKVFPNSECKRYIPETQE